METTQISKEKVIAIIDDEVDYWAMFIMTHGQGEDADVSAWALMAVLDQLKEQINGLSAQ